MRATPLTCDGSLGQEAETERKRKKSERERKQGWRSTDQSDLQSSGLGLAKVASSIPKQRVFQLRAHVLSGRLNFPQRHAVRWTEKQFQCLYLNVQLLFPVPLANQLSDYTVFPLRCYCFLFFLVPAIRLLSHVTVYPGSDLSSNRASLYR